MNKELYEKLLNATKYFQTIESYDKERHRKDSQLADFEENEINKRNKAITSSRILKDLCLVVLIGCSVVLFLIFIVMAAGVKANSSDWALLGFLITLDLFAVLGFIIGSKIYTKVKKDENRRFENEVTTIIQKGVAEIMDLKKQRDEFCSTYENLISFLPSSYRNIQASSYMLITVINGRADTLKELFNLYEEQLHRWKLENIAKQNAEAQQFLAMAVDELNLRQAETNLQLRYANEILRDIKSQLKN